VTAFCIAAGSVCETHFFVKLEKAVRAALNASSKSRSSAGISDLPSLAEVGGGDRSACQPSLMTARATPSSHWIAQGV
jgi:hypothetical protein